MTSTDSIYATELAERASTLRAALHTLGRVDGVSQATYDGVQAALATVEGQLELERSVSR